MARKRRAYLELKYYSPSHIELKRVHRHTERSTTKEHRHVMTRKEKQNLNQTV